MGVVVTTIAKAARLEAAIREAEAVGADELSLQLSEARLLYGLLLDGHAMPQQRRRRRDEAYAGSDSKLAQVVAQVRSAKAGAEVMDILRGIQRTAYQAGVDAQGE